MIGGAALVAALASSGLGNDGTVGPIALRMTPADVHARIGRGKPDRGLGKTSEPYYEETYHSGPDGLRLLFTGRPLRLDSVELFHDAAQSGRSRFANWRWQGSGLYSAPPAVRGWRLTRIESEYRFTNASGSVEAHYDRLNSHHGFSLWFEDELR